MVLAGCRGPSALIGPPDQLQQGDPGPCRLVVWTPEERHERLDQPLVGQLQILDSVALALIGSAKQGDGQ